MKSKFFLLVVVCLPIFVWGQDFSKEDNANAPIYESSATFESYLQDNIEYPKEAIKCFNQGTVVVQFVVNANGELSDFKVINSVCPEIDKEVIRVVKTTDGMWKPALTSGKPVPMIKEVSMMFATSVEVKDLEAPVEYFTLLARNCWMRGNKLLVEKHNLKRAMKQYDEAIKYLPYDGAALLARGLCKYELGDKEGARSDWERINRIGRTDADSFLKNMACLKGYNEAMAYIEK
jgi:TonB family protein